MKDLILSIASKYDFDLIGFVKVSDYTNHRKSLNIDDKYNDFKKLVDYKTIITLALQYPSQPVSYKGKGFGLLSRFAYGEDYHIVFRNKLKDFCLELNKSNIKTNLSVDTGDIDERLAAYLSGLGFIGKNHFLINKKFGSYLYLGTVLIDSEIETLNTIVQEDCENCNICVKSCPTNSLENNFNKDTCISQITQLKEELSFDEISKISKYIYGCDICQNVCPKNKGIDFHNHPEFEPNGLENVDILNLFNMSNKDYLNIYGNNTSSWRGKLVILRNGLCILSNQKLIDFLPKIEKSIKDYSNISWYKETAKKVIEILEEKR